MNAAPSRAASVAAWLFAAAAMMLCVAAVSFVDATEPRRNRIDFDLATIPDDAPKSWPKEINQCVQVPRQKFLSLVKQIQDRDRGPRQASLMSAHYEASLVGETLCDGLMTASVKRLGERPVLLELGKFTLALEDLKWQGRPAIWGTARDGRTWVLADSAQDELLGEWSCRGRVIPGGVDFDLQLPSATISILDLRIPGNLSIYAPTADVKLLSETAEETKLWRLHFSGDNHCRVTFLNRQSVEKSGPTLMVTKEMRVSVGAEDLRFQLDLHLESLDAPVDEIGLKIPAGLEIYSAVYGIETPVPIQRHSEAEGERRVSIRLPGLLKGRRRVLKIEGITAQKPDRLTTVPQVQVENSVFDGGTLAVTVQPPLQVQSIRTEGYAQRTAEGERKYTFQQLAPDAKLVLDVHRAPVSMSGQLLSVLAVEDETWDLTSEIRWDSQTGGGYQASCVFPPDWEVTDVNLVGGAEKPTIVGAFAAPPKLTWDIAQRSNGGSTLTIEFLDPIQPGLGRTVTVVARRNPPQQGQAIPIPLPRLVNCDITDVSFGLELPSALTAAFSSDSRLERVARPDQTRLAIPSPRPNFDRRWYRCDSPESAGTLLVSPRLQPVNVTTETVIDAQPAEYRVRYSIRSEQRETQADRLLVYLTEASPDVRWVWKGSQPIEMNAVHLSKSQHVELDLPSKGELWEIPLPRTIGKGVAIEGTATYRWPANSRPALLYVPQAVEKLAELKLTHSENLELTFNADGMKPTGDQLSWWYSTPHAEFDLAVRNPEPSREFPLMVSMQLHTMISGERDGADLYRARLQLENGSSQDSLRIKLDRDADLQEAFVSGEAINVIVQNGEFVVPGLSAARRDTLEFVYRVPARTNFFYQKRRIVVPQVSCQVLGFFWRFGLSSSSCIYSAPPGVQLVQTPASPTWNERLFGPLGRSQEEAFFRAWRTGDWVQLLQPSVSLAANAGAEDDANTSLDWQATAPTPPAEIQIELWHAGRLELLSWIVLAIVLILGIVIRIRSYAYREHFAAYVLGFSIAGSMTVPAPLVLFFGAVTAAVLLAVLIPESLLAASNRTSRSSEEHPFKLQGALSAFVIGGITVVAASSMLELRCAAQEPGFEDAPNRRPVVYLPVDRQGEPSDTLLWVYVPRDALEQWQAIANEIGVPPDYLISSARYSVGANRDSSLNVVARYRVHLLATSELTTIDLPISDVNLPDSESCRINGVAYPISVAPNGKGYSIELDSGSKPRSDDDVSTIEIELSGRKPSPQGTNFDLRIPKVANSRFEYSFPNRPGFVEVVGSQGATERHEDGNSVVSSLGSTASVLLRWGESVPKRNAPQITASMLQHLELRPGYSELLFHLDAGIDEGSLDTLEFDLPPNASLRRIQSREDNFLQRDVVITNDGRRRLRLIFEKSHHAPISIDGAFVLAETVPSVKIPLPTFGIAPSDSYQFHYVRNWWGVSTSPEFRLEPVDLGSESVATVPADTYLDAWASTIDPRHVEASVPHQTQFTFEQREGMKLAFSRVLGQPKRRAMEWRQIGIVGRRQLEWIVEGEIETSQAATFQTVLIADRRLMIDEMTVTENGAGRLIRWTESRTEPSRIVLFLKDPTQGVQKIRIRGSLPLVTGVPTVLPSIRVDDCEMGTMQLILARDLDVEVGFDPPAGWKPQPVEELSLEGFASSPIEPLGRFQTNDFDARGTIQTSSRYSRCSSRAMATLTRTEGSAWQLKYRLEMSPEGEAPVRIGLTFPATFGDFHAVNVDNAEPVWHDPSEGTRRLDLLLNRREPHGKVVVQFEIVLAEPKQPDWELPLPTPPSPLLSSGQETLIAIEPETLWFPKSGREMRIDDLPKWATAFFENCPDDGLAFSVSGASIEIQRDVAVSDQRSPLIRLLDQMVWLHQGGLRSGVTQAFVSSLRSDLDFHVPPGVNVTSVFVDEHPVALTGRSKGHLKVSVADLSAESILTITWNADQTVAGAQLSEPLLWPHDIQVDKSLVTILPDAPIVVARRTGLTSIGSIDQGLDHLEMLLDRQPLLGTDTRASVANRWMLEQIYSKLKTRLAAEVRSRSQPANLQLQRWNRIVRRLNQLEVAPPQPPINWTARLLDGPGVDSDAAVRGVAHVQTVVRVWRFDRRLLRTVVVVLLILILLPICRFAQRIDWSGWLHRRPAVSWFLLATIWWLFLTPSVLGCIMLMFAITRAMRGRASIRSVG